MGSWFPRLSSRHTRGTRCAAERSLRRTHRVQRFPAAIKQVRTWALCTPATAPAAKCRWEGKQRCFWLQRGNLLLGPGCPQSRSADHPHALGVRCPSCLLSTPASSLPEPGRLDLPLPLRPERGGRGRRRFGRTSGTGRLLFTWAEKSPQWGQGRSRSCRGRSGGLLVYLTALGHVRDPRGKCSPCGPDPGAPKKARVKPRQGRKALQLLWPPLQAGGGRVESLEGR